MNAIEKDVDGNYLVSARYLSTIFKINGQDGSVMWRMNGKNSDFKMEGFNTVFGFQHDVRIISQNASTTVISLFNNAYDGYHMVSPESSAMIMAVNNETMVTTLLKEFKMPFGGISVKSQGSVQVLDNSNVVVGWGYQPFISEYTADGNCVMNIQYGVNNSAAMSYRVHKETWDGVPQSLPAIWTYSNTTTSPMSIFVSWNGHTAVTTWKFYGGKEKDDIRTVIGEAPKSGFETTFIAKKYYNWTYAEALDASGKSLGITLMQQTFVPGHNSTGGSMLRGSKRAVVW